MQNFSITPLKGYDYINVSDPGASVNPPAPHASWLNSTTGAFFICTDNTVDANVWVNVGSAYSPKRALVQRTSDQTIATATVDNIDWQSAVYDTGGFWENVTNPDRLTVPAGIDLVRIHVNIRWDSSSTGYRQATLYKDGSGTGATLAGDICYLTTSQVVLMSFSTAPIPVVEGNYFTIALYHTGGSDRTIDGTEGQTWISIEEVK